MAEKTVTPTRERQSSAQREMTRGQDRYVVPPVDIYDTPEGLVLLADLPGVAKEDLNVQVDNHVLTLHARARHMAPGEPLYREYELVNFFRQFELNEDVDQERLAAQLNHGVLTLRLPRVERAQPRKIAVQVS